MKTSTTSCATNGNKQTRTSSIDGAVITSAPKFVSLMFRKVRQSLLLTMMILTLLLGVVQKSIAQSVITNPTSPWIVPAGVTSIKVEVWGGGGGGGGCNSVFGTSVGSGGGGGAYNVSTFSVSGGQSYAITIGTGGTAVSDANGGNGTASSVSGPGGSIAANPGTGGARRGGTAGAGGTGGFNNGGAGGTATSNGAGGGGGAGNATPTGTGNGGNGSNTTAGTAGAGTLPGGIGGATVTGNGTGNFGVAPGGGGGGGRQSGFNGAKAGGVGGAGKVVITYTCPSATISYSGTSFCKSTDPQSVTITGSTGGTFSATPAGLTINSSTGVITPSSSTPQTYTVHYIIPASGSCLQVDATASVTIDLPTATIAYSGPYCGTTGTATVTQAGQTGGTYSATPDGLAINTSTGEIDLATSSAGTYTVTYSFSDGTCSNTTTANVILGGVGISNVTSNSPICPGTSLTLNQTSIGGTSYEWRDPDNNIISTDPNPTISNVTKSGTYTLNVSSSCGTVSGTTVVDFKPVPDAPTIVTATPATICIGTSSMLNATSTDNTISWYSAGTGGSPIGTSTSGADFSVSPAVTTIYYAEALSSGGCINSTRTPVTVTLNSPPLAFAGGNQSICQDGVATVSGASASNGTILWSSNGHGTLSGETTPTPTYTPSIEDAGNTVILTMTVTSDNVCAPATASATYSVFVYASSVGGNAAADQSICSGTSPANIVLSGYLGSIQWQVSTDGSVFNNISGATSATLTSAQMGTLTATRYYQAVVKNNGCAATHSNTVTVTINPLPEAVTVSSVPTCGSALLTASGGTGGTIYWQNTTSNGTSTATPSSQQTVTTNGTYYFRAMSASGCWSTQGSLAVTISSTAAQDRTVAASATSVCTGTSVNITVATSLANSTYTLRNNANNSIIAGPTAGNGGTLTFSTGPLTTTTTFNVLATRTVSGCTLQMTNTPTVGVATGGPVSGFSSSATTVPAGGSVTFTDNSTNFPTSWSWSFPGGTPSSSTNQNPVITYNTTGYYDVTLTTSSSCGTGNTLTISKYITVSNASNSTTFPNPGTFDFTPPGCVSQIIVEAWGGGGKGGSVTAAGVAGGGGGGAYSKTVIPVIYGVNYAVVVGSGSSTTSPGGDSYFGDGSLLLAKGGSSVADGGTSGVAGGLASAGIGTTKFSGGTGGNSLILVGGGGGSSAGIAANGGNGGSGSAGTAPTGGGNGGAPGNPASAGLAPGGGGGGAAALAAALGGAGANGKVVITYSTDLPPTISLENIPAICHGITSTYIPYSSTTGNPDLYSIVFDPAAISQGFTNVTGAALPAAQIPISVPAGSVAGTYTGKLILEKSSNTCFSSEYSISIKVEASPVATAGGSQTICNNGTATVSGATAQFGSILWTEDGAGSITSGESTLSPVYTAAIEDAGKTVTLTMTVTSNNTCSPATATADYTITVAEPVIPAVSIAASSGIDAICAGSSVTFTATPTNGGSPIYQWKLNGTTNVGTNSATFTTTTLSNGDQISCVMTSSVQCAVNPANSNTITMAVKPLPGIFNVTGGGGYCADGTGVDIKLSGSETGVNYELFKGATTTGNIIQGTGSSLTFANVKDGGNYTIVASNITTTCPATMSGSATVIVNPLPFATASTPSPLCQFSDVLLTADGGGIGGSYLWEGPYITTANNKLQNPTIIGMDDNFLPIFAPGTYNYKVTVTTAAGCTATATTSVLINLYPDATAENNSPVCEGQPLILTAGENWETYTWTDKNGKVVGTDRVVTIPATESGTYTVSLFNSLCGGSNSATTEVIVNPMPALPVAENVTETYDGLSHTGSVDPVSGIDIVWYTALTDGSVTTAPTRTDVGTSTAYAQATNSVTKCTNPTRIPVTVTINPRPITITVDPGQTKSCEENDPVLKFTPGGLGLANGDTFTGELHRAAGSAVGPYAVDQGTLKIFRGSVDNMANYAVTFIGADFTITDLIPPVITCPKDITQSAEAGVCGAHVTFEATATDNCSAVVTYSQAPGTLFPIGTTPVTATATDQGNNQVSCTFNVTVTDNENPVITCPADIIQNNDPGICGAAVSFIASATDNCSAVITYDKNPGSIFPVGTTAVKVTATDPSGNFSECTFNVTVLDKENPTINCPADITQSASADACSAIVTFDVTATDNCPAGAIVTYSQNPGTSFPVGTTKVTATATDPAGNSSTCSFNVTVVDNTPPLVKTKIATVQIPVSGSVTILPADIDDGSSDPCGIKSMSVSPNTFACGEVGDHTVTLTVTDNNNNTAFATAVVTVKADLVQAIAKDITIQLDNTGHASITAAMVDNGSSGACGLAPMSVSPSDFDCSNVGVNTVVLTVTNVHGVSSTATAHVTVQDKILPTVYAKNITLELDASGKTRIITPADLDDLSFDNCGIFKFGLSQNSFDCSNIGPNSVFLFASDKSLNSGVAMATVTVVDLIPPAITCPASIIQTAEPGVCGAHIGFAALATDNCSAEITYSQDPGTVFPVGVTTVTATATDPAGNHSSCSFTVTVTDNENPVITNLPANIVMDNDAGACNAVVTWTEPTATDNCGIQSLNSDHASGETFPVGTTTVIYTATDIHGNALTASFTVTVNDTELPVITGKPADISVNNAAGQCSAVVTWAALAANDNCSIATFTGDHASGDTFNGGETIVTYTATDIHGNKQTASFKVTVIDVENPVITDMPADIVVVNDATKCGAEVTWNAPKATDNCSVQSFTSDYAPGASFPIGVTKVTYTAVDAHGNSTTASFNVTVTDNEKPVISNLPANIVKDNDAGVCSAVVTWTEPTATDNCGVQSLNSDHASGETFPVGTTTVIYTATDIHGNALTASFTVTVNDTELPVITGKPADISVNNAAGQCSAVVTWAALAANDNCGIATFTGDHASGDTFNGGETIVTYTATDIHGNKQTASFKVTVIDVENPVITDMPADIVVVNDATKCGAEVTWNAPKATDNCSVQSFTSDYAPGASFPVGVTKVTYTAVDAHGNSTTASFNVTVTDNEKPVISNLPANIVKDNDAGVCSAVVTWTEPTATDNCGVQSLNSDHASGETFPVGTTTVIYTATDIHGNALTASFTVTVNDTELPVITGKPADISVNNAAGQCSAVVTWAALAANDNCGIATFTGDHASGDTFNGGETIVTYTATDIHGNKQTASFKVTVIDVENPVITDMPADIVVVNDATKCGAEVTWNAPKATDNCSVQSFTSDYAPGASFPIGVTKVTYTAVDAHGNSTTASFNVTVTDNEKPVISNLPANIVKDNDAGVCSAVVTWTEPTATDNCGVQSLNSDHASGETFPVGTTTVIYTATDIHGNALTASFTVTVNDTELPVITGKPADISVNNAAGQCSAVVTWAALAANDNCGIATFTGDHASGEAFPVGVTTVTFTATDIHTNVQTATFTVTVIDNEKPVISGIPANISKNNDKGVCGAAATWTAPTAADNCSILSLTSNHASGDVFPLGVTTVTYTATDIHTNVQTGSFTVTVKDNESPVITTNGDKNVSTDLNVCGATVAVSATASDNCSVPTPTGIRNDNLALNALYPVGITTIKWNVNDGNGNAAAEVTQTVTVTDNQKPTVITQNVTVALDGTGHATVTAAQINNGSNDACGIKSMSLSKTDFTSADVVNPNVVTLSVTDNNGNVGTGTATVTVTAIQINVVALPQTKVYGDPDPELKYTFTPALLGNDSFTGTLSRAAGNSVNTYAINQGTLALPGYYKINFTKADLTITPRPVTVRADAQTKQWGTSDPTLTYQVTSGTLVYNESCEGSLTRDPGEDVGIYQIRQGTLHLSSNYTLKYEGNTFTITQKSMLPSVTVSPATIQYSDEVTFTARITLGAPLLSGRLHPSASVTFKIGAQDMGTVQLRVKGLDLEGKLTTTLSERIKGQMAPGNKVVYAVFSFSDRKMTVSPNPATSNLMITQEDARVTVTGTYIQSTNSFGKSFDDGKVLLKATIQDITACRGEQDYDPNAGDIRNARVRFMKGTTPITNWLIPDLVNGRDTKTGVVNAKWSFDGASRDVPNDIRVEVGGDGYYVRNNPSDLSVVTLYTPTGDYVAGGGYLSNPNNSDGSFHGTPGLRTNFGFVVKYTNKGTNPQGNMDFIFRRMIDGQVHTYQINSTSITYVAVNDVFRCGKNALITAKANLNEITNPDAPLLMGSNLKLLVRMSDYGDNASGDRIAISLWNGFSLLFSSNWNGLLTTQTLLGDGNLIIHSGFNFGDIFKGQADDGQEHLLTSEIGVKAYPNPFTDHVYFDLSLPTDSKVRLEVYNVDGSKVSTLYDDVVVAYDHYRLEFAPNKLSSNILIYRLIVDGKLEFTGKLIHK